MKLLIINDQGISGGGTENRIRIFVDMLLSHDTPSEIHILQKGITPIPKEYIGNTHLFFHFLKEGESAYWKTRRIISKYSITLAQVHNLLLMEPYVVLAAKHAGIPVVWWAHDYWLLCAKRSFIDPFHAMHKKMCYTSEKGHTCECMSFKTKVKYHIWQWAMNHASLAIAPGKILQQIHESEGILQGKWRVVTPWIDSIYISKKNSPSKQKNLQNNQKKEQKEQMLLYVGSLIEFKGAWVAAKALKHIVQKFPNVKLVFVGSEQEPESRYRKGIEEICTNDGTLNHVVFLGKKEKKELFALHQNAALYLCPTVCMESFGLNWAEAMASGCLVIASAIGSIPEYIKDNETGILFPPRDDRTLAKNIIALLSDNKKRTSISLNGKAFAQKHFTSQRATTEILALYNTLLSKQNE